EEAPFGVTGLETAFAAIYTHLVEPGQLDLGLVLERMSAGPARIFGLPVPRIEVGESANLVLIDLDATWTVTEDRFASQSVNSWLLGETLTGTVVKTIAGGRVVYAA
ncbi:MAG: amidohydrolase family protein, partial [Gaiellaceae bacterium]